MPHCDKVDERLLTAKVQAQLGLADRLATSRRPSRGDVTDAHPRQLVPRLSPKAAQVGQPTGADCHDGRLRVMLYMLYMYSTCLPQPQAG